MGDKTGIEWTDATWNPLVGCDRVSAGCDHCYAIPTVARGEAMGTAQHAGLTIRTANRLDWNGEITVVDHLLEQPLRWRRPRRIFVNSLSDLFHPAVPDDTIARIFAVMALAPQHTFQVLTKRPQRMADLLSSTWDRDGGRSFEALADHHVGDWDSEHFTTWPLPNVWLGTSIELDKYAFRADHLRRTPAALRFISAEPLLGPLPSLDLTGIDWLIVGGESGPAARPMHPDWVRDLRDRSKRPDCADDFDACHFQDPPLCPSVGCSTQPAFFFKQWGAWLGFGPDAYGDSIALAAQTGSVHKDWLDTPRRSASVRVGKKAAGRELDGRTWDEIPERAS